ncbi:hypothetical protein RHMOL_Rhmol04G0203200 [Rhododendron molle]|uniref:Uncharacterized protein n=1 Tax=Rhododendron molle TaxID=49168 RepID=A0ACC0P3R2_RHOML|nr:hypothetical protein RHMOL_Rhmol04G0203200 [Rhododendron molle]
MASSEAIGLPPSSSTSVLPFVAGSFSHPPCRGEYPSFDEEAVGELGQFDAITYALPLRRLCSNGFLQYRPPVGGPEAKVVHREYEQHLSVLNAPISIQKSKRRLEACGGGKEVHKWFLTLPKQAWELIDPKLWQPEGALEWFLGKVPPLHSHGHVNVSWLSKTFLKADILTQVSVEQLTRAFLLYLLGQTLFANKDSSVHTQFFAPLQHLEAVWEFDWGAYALATLYGNLGTYSRDKSLILGGHYRVLELQLDPWSGMPEDTCLAHSKVLDRTRSPLEGSFCQAWYLGDQVASQWRPHAEALQLIPPPPPASMRSTSSMSKEDLRNARIETGRACFFKQVPAEIVQEWLRAYQSANALVWRQRRRILELEAERALAVSREDMGTSERSLSSSQRSSQRCRHDQL